MFSEYELVRLQKTQAGVDAGTVGTVVMVYASDPPGYEVEFADSNGVTTALLTLFDGDLDSID